MRAGGTIDTGTVGAARSGDRRAIEELVAIGLPLVYSVVRRALDTDDIDDVVQDVMVRALRGLPDLRRPESFRSWLTAIAVHEIGTHLQRRDTAARRSAPLDVMAGTPDQGAEFENLTALHLGLSSQRQQVRHAGYWLDPEDRVVLSLWLLETAGELTRADLAAALGISVAHAGVRVQRMRQQLDAGREIVAVLENGPACAALDAVIGQWDGVPGPLWRKRLARHIRSCGICRPSADAMIPVERLLPGLALLPVPAGLAAAVIGKSGVAATSAAALATSSATSGGLGVKAGLIGQLVQAVTAHPIAASIAAGVVAAVAAVTVTSLPEPAPRAPQVIAAPTSSSAAPAVPGPRPSSHRPATARPSATAPGVPIAGRPLSLESGDRPGLFVTTAGDLGILAPVRAAGSRTARRQATFTAVEGLADRTCFSFRARDGRYLRHASWRLRLDGDQKTPLFRGDATFCVRSRLQGAIALESANYPGWFLHRRGDELWVDQQNGSAAFRAETSFRTRAALAD
ncbi:sigma-70 family RNA polymerase sigma factor [Couchioplanes caeruleus]|uniref:sigma-70 family RNA polymerase sigma factor n=1 Tax=Couchioplanes caeruleus TaxID=56438 RepID=UPI00201BD6A0|nr:sigma-70 family RNA polymerase sigma factor [Couchioplanes caeruleus]UQU67265.1 sigma-70 family RNA polymerase sigma factor [Couchioplanes caeruleus]